MLNLPRSSDLKPAFVVFLVALPLCLGVALASGAPASSGLIAGIVGGLIVGFLSPSEISVSGPAAGLTIVVLQSIQKLGSYEAFCLAVVISGVLQLIFSQIKLGKLAHFIPVSVIKGMLAAIGLIIILKQIPHFLGLDVDQIGEMEFIQADGENTFSEIFKAFNLINLGALTIGSISALIIYLWDKFSAKNKTMAIFPSALLAVAASIFINEIILPHFSLNLSTEHLVLIPQTSEIFKFHNPLEFLKLDVNLLTIAATLAIVGSLESLLSIEASEKIDPLKRTINPDKELKAQGVGNIISGLLGGLPLTAVIVRTSANAASGGLRRWSCIFHGLLILISILMIPQVLGKIPLAVLATILIFVGAKLVSLKQVKEKLKGSPSQYVPFFATILAILFTDLLIGVGIGLLIGIFYVIRNNMSESIISVQENNRYLVRFCKDVSFLNKPVLKKHLAQIPPQCSVVIDGSRSVFIDKDIIDIIEDFCEYAKAKNIDVELKKSPLALSAKFRI